MKFDLCLGHVVSLYFFSILVSDEKQVHAVPVNASAHGREELLQEVGELLLGEVSGGEREHQERWLGTSPFQPRHNFGRRLSLRSRYLLFTYLGTYGVTPCRYTDT